VSSVTSEPTTTLQTAIHEQTSLQPETTQNTLSELQQRKAQLLQEIEILENQIAASNATLTALQKTNQALQRVIEAIEQATGNSGRKRRSLTYSIDQDGDTVTVDPYCEVNEDNAVTGNPTDLLLTMIDDLSTKLANLTTDQITCFNQLIENFATLIENGTFVIDSSVLDNITAAVEAASSIVGDQVQSVQLLVNILQEQKQNKTDELDQVESQLAATTGRKPVHKVLSMCMSVFSLDCTRKF